MQDKSSILIINLEATSFGGQETHTLELFKMFLKNSFSAHLVTATQSPLARTAQKELLTVHQSSLFKIANIRFLFYFLFSRYIQKICKKHTITTIYCNNRFEAPAAIRIAKKMGIKVVLTRHLPDEFRSTSIKNIDTVLCVSPTITSYIEKENNEKNLCIKNITHVAPLFNADKFLTFKPTTNRQDFFKQQFNITMQTTPIICMIGNMVPDIAHKNHPLLFKAVAHILQEKNLMIQVVLAGSGPNEQYLKNMAKELKIDSYIHFLGFTDQTPAILHHSDIFVLSSSKEAFGIVFLEAGLMKKPAIGARKTGAEVMIVHEKTGLLFENNDTQDLANAIEQLILNPTYAQTLGENAYDHIMKNFIPDVTFAKYAAQCEGLQSPDQA